jgi:hypothetical protein
MDVLEWSMPFLMDKVVSMLTHITTKAGMNSPAVVNEDLKELLEN